LVNIDCQVLANPGRSVHFAWFASYGANQSVADWLERDVSLDEQLDDTGAQLKFRVKDEDSFALIKCKAKNEIGLQQRVCLFQIVAAREPELRHSCSLASVAAQTLGLQCQLNDHLKTNQLQQWSSPDPSGPTASAAEQAAAASTPGGAGAGASSKLPPRNDPLMWMRTYNAMRQSLAGGELLTSMSSRRLQQQRRPRLRQVYPPDWLLVELYRSVAPNGTQPADQPPPAVHDYELQSYVIVAPGAQQLARVKAIVEENKLFHAQPRDIYYVAAKTDPKQPQARQQLGDSADSAAVAGQQQQQPLDDDQPEELATDQQQLAAVIKEPGLRLPVAFNFTVPNLEPASQYKLLVYGQNLANRTRDWLVVRAETAAGQLHQTAAAAQKAVKNLVLDQDQADQANYSAPAQALGQSKSIVMRSEQAPEKSDRAESQQQQQQQPTAAGSQPDSGEPTAPPGAQNRPVASDPTAGRSDDDASRLLVQIHEYKEQAVAYVKQKPLMTIPVALASCLMIVLLVVYLSGLFVNLIRRRTPAANNCGHSNDSSHSGSADSTTSRASSSNQHSNQKQGSLVKSISTLDEHDDDDNVHDDDGRPHSCDKSQQQQRRDEEAGSKQHHQLDSLVMPARLELDCHVHSSLGSFNGGTIAKQQNYHHHHHPTAVSLHAPEADGSSPWSCLDALALADQQHQMLATRPSWREPLNITCPGAAGYHDGGGLSAGAGQMLGSLDRRGHFHPAAAIYLAPDSAPHSTLSDHHQESIPLVDGLIHQSQAWRDAQHRHLAAGGSIDRRAGIVFQQQQQQQQQYQPLFISDQHQRGHQLAEQVHLAQRPEPKSRARLRSSKSSVQSTQHRVAFDLSNQEPGQQQQQDNEYASGGLLQLTRSSGQDSSSGSNNSTAANTADSGHESPATTGGETNSCQSGRQRPHQAHAIQILESSSGHGLLTMPPAMTVMPGCRQKQPQPKRALNMRPLDDHYHPSGCGHVLGPSPLAADNQQQQQLNSCVELTGGRNPMQVMLMEFASPSSQESSTFMQSADSSFDANNNNSRHGEQQQQRDRPTAAYLLHQNCQMATSFASKPNSNAANPAARHQADEETSARDTDNWL
jgi:hypothetical protein